ncbi:MAG: hypothetical protein PQJ46_00380 [Spirochaetales bacterium]|nr:hypothetical protein [Spirochaetales bacterium]
MKNKLFDKYTGIAAILVYVFLTELCISLGYMYAYGLNSIKNNYIVFLYPVIAVAIISLVLTVLYFYFNKSLIVFYFSRIISFYTSMIVYSFGISVMASFYMFSVLKNIFNIISVYDIDIFFKKKAL